MPNYPVLLHVNYSGISPVNLSGVSINQFQITQYGTPDGLAYASGTNNQLILQGSHPPAAPWTLFTMNTDNNYSDITLNIEEAYLNGYSLIDIWFRMQEPLLAGGENGGYHVSLFPQNNEIFWQKMLPWPYDPIVKTISHTFSFPAKARIVFEGKVMSVYLDDVFIDSCDYTAFDESIPGYDYQNGPVGFRQYEPWAYKFNSILLKVDPKGPSVVVDPHSALLNVNYSGLAPFNASGTNVNQFRIITDTTSSEYVSGTSNVLRLHGNQNPWCSFYSNTNDTYNDLTLNIESGVESGYSMLGIFFRVNNIASAFIAGYKLYLVQYLSDYDGYNTIVWMKVAANGEEYVAKSIRYPFYWPAKARIVFDEQIMSLYLDDVFVDSYDFTNFIPQWVYPSGPFAFRQYGEFNMDFNSITYKGDRKQNIGTA